MTQRNSSFQSRAYHKPKPRWLELCFLSGCDGCVLRVCQRSKWQHFDVSVVSVEVDTFEFSLVDQTCLEHLRALHSFAWDSGYEDAVCQTKQRHPILPGLGVLVGLDMSLALARTQGCRLQRLASLSGTGILELWFCKGVKQQNIAMHRKNDKHIIIVDVAEYPGCVGMVKHRTRSYYTDLLH